MPNSGAPASQPGQEGLFIVFDYQLLAVA